MHDMQEGQGRGNAGLIFPLQSIHIVQQADPMPQTFATRAELREEMTDAVCEIAICIAQAIHEIDPQAHRRMNFSAGKAYNQLIANERPLAADILYRFGRALMDRELFPEKDNLSLSDSE